MKRKGCKIYARERVVHYVCVPLWMKKKNVCMYRSVICKRFYVGVGVGVSVGVWYKVKQNKEKRSTYIKEYER